MPSSSANRQYASYAAYVLAISLGLALVLFAVRGRFEPVIIVSGALAVVSAIAWVILDWPRFRDAFYGRQVKYGSSSMLLTVSFLGILVLINITSNHYYHRFDATANKLYSLSPQTLQALASITDTVEIYSFFAPNDSRQKEFENVLEEYLHRSRHLKYTAVDPDLQPTLAKQLEVSSAGTIVFVHGDRKQKIYGIQEQDITGAILRVLRSSEPKAYFVSGHQERDPESYKPEGFSTIAKAMKDEGYTVETLNLASGTALPEDAAMIVLASPRQALSSEEESRLASYLQGGGRLFVLSDPGLEAPLATTLASYGLQWNNDVIIDLQLSLMGNIATPLTNSYPFSAITRDMQGLTTFFPYARSLTLLQANLPEGVQTQPLVTSGPDAWGETDLQNANPVYEADKDLKGPLNICATAENTESKTRIVACGDSEFASNDIFSTFSGSGNGDLFMNAVNWLAEEEQLISIRPKPPTMQTVMLTPEQGRAVQIITAVLMPLTIAIIGAMVWWRRRV